MSWLLFAMSGPVLWAVSTHCDKYLLTNHFKGIDSTVLLIFTIVAGLLTLPFIWFFKPAVVAVAASNAIVMILSGLLYIVAMYFYFRALQFDEASVVSPFFQTAPLFGYLLGYLVLGEKLSLWQTVGGGLIVCGTLLISLSFDSASFGVRRRVALPMLACAFLLALSALLFKQQAIEDDFWTTTFWSNAGTGIFGIGLVAGARYRDQLRVVLQSRAGRVLAISTASELFNLAGNFGARYALLLAPLSLVQAVSSTSAVFVLVFGILLSALCPRLAGESFSTRELAQKSASVALVVVGGIIIALA